MVRATCDLLVMRVRRISMSSSGETTISVYRSMPRSWRRNSARPSEKMTSYFFGSARVGWNVVDQKAPLSTSRT